jgi:hypothetical protein
MSSIESVGYAAVRARQEVDMPSGYVSLHVPIEQTRGNDIALSLIGKQFTKIRS